MKLSNSWQDLEGGQTERPRPTNQWIDKGAD